jgi:Polyketide cyclase / dehydrase and lipid transport
LRVEHTHEFEVPLEGAFAYITSLASWPDYWPGIRRVEPGSAWQTPGDEARIVVRLLGRDVELTMRLGRLEANRLLEYESRQDGLPDARHVRRFEPTEEGFRFGISVEYEPRTGVRGVYDRVVVRRGIERAILRTVANLEEVLPRAVGSTTPSGA